MELGKLTAKQIEAAKLVAGKKHTIQQIAERVGVSTRTIDYWKTDATFQVEVDRVRNLWRLTVRKVGLADPEIRLHDLNDLRNRLFGVIHARAKDPEMQEVPGGKTGLLTKTYKIRAIGQGETIAEPEYRVDHKLFQDAVLLQTAIRAELACAGDEMQLDDFAQKIIEKLNEARRRAAAAKKNQSEITIQASIEPPADGG
jgi:DNA-binding CsgD family transcriptional regulator